MKSSRLRAATQPLEAAKVPLSRELLTTGEFAGMAALDNPGLRLSTEEERDRSLAEILKQRPEGPLWLFAYGSLMWNPTVVVSARKVCIVEGWHRSFCLSVLSARGTPENPGITLALDEGGRCEGVALRLSEQNLYDELRLLWRREMIYNSYIPKWVPVQNKNGRHIANALAFTSDRSSACYAGNLPYDEIVSRLAKAQGSLGTSAEYLFRTRDALRRLGIADAKLEKLAQQVELVRFAEMREPQTADLRKDKLQKRE